MRLRGRRAPMTTRLLALLALLLPSLAHGAITWTCVKDGTSVQINFYETVGTCTPGAGNTYTAGAGGDPIGTSAVATAAAAAVCQSSNQVLLDLMLSPSADGAGATPTNSLPAFDHTAFKVVEFCGAASGVVLAE